MTRSFRASITALAFSVAAATSTASAQATSSVSNKAVASNLTSSVGELGLYAAGDNIIGAIAQTFAAPTNYALLQSFRFFFTSGFGDTSDQLKLQVDIYAFNATTRNIVGPSLYATSSSGTGDLIGDVSDPSYSGLLDFPVVNLSLSPGATYAFLFRPTLTSPDGATNLALTTIADTYTGGQLFYSSSTTNSTLSSAGAFTGSNSNSFGADAKFEATFGRTSVVPEPNSIALVAVGLAGIIIVSLRRRVIA